MVEILRRPDGKFVSKTSLADAGDSSDQGSDNGDSASPVSIDLTAIAAENGNAGGDGRAADSEAGGAPKRKRGRQPGFRPNKTDFPQFTKTLTGSQKQSLDLTALTDLLFAVHMGIAAVTRTPEFALDAEEASKLAKASANVMRHYDVGTTQKTMDWIQLSIALGVIYAPRIMVLSAKAKPARAPAPQPPSGTPVNGGF